MIKSVACKYQHVQGLSDEQIETLKEHTTVNNPKYKQAAKFSKWGPPKKIPKNITYYAYDSDEECLVLPRGIDVESVLNEDCNVVDLSLHTPALYPKFQPKLRPLQKTATDSYLKSYSEDKFPKGIIHLPTGLGKTICALYLAQKLRIKALVLVHKSDLVVGWQKDIEFCFNGKLKPGLIQGKNREIGEQITIATFQTIGRMSHEEFKELTIQFGMVIHDEVHHCAASTFSIVHEFMAHYRLGLSATPHRSDGLDCCFEFYFGGLCYEYDYSKEDDFISKLRVIVRKNKFRFLPIVVHERIMNGKLRTNQVSVYNYYDFEDKGKIPGEFEFLESIDYRDRPRVPSAVVDSLLMKNIEFRRQVLNDVYKEYRLKRCILLLFSQKEWLDLFYDSFTEFVPEKDCVKFYGDSKKSDEDIIDSIAKGKKKVTFATYSKVSEGTNVKNWEVLFLVSSIVDPKNVEQALGRIRRRMDGKINPVRVYDYKSSCYQLRNHFPKRLEVYRKLRCDIRQID